MPNIKALRIEPGTTPIETCLGTSLKELQAAVDGYIEMVPLDKACNILCNEEGKLKGLTPNRLFGSDVIAGRFFVVKVDDDGELTDLNDGDISKYYEMFKTPLTEAQTEYYDRILSIFRE